MRYDHQTFQVPKMEVLTYVSCMDRAYGRENPPPKIAENKVQETLHFRYLKFLVIWYKWMFGETTISYVKVWFIIQLISNHL